MTYSATARARRTRSVLAALTALAALAVGATLVGVLTSQSQTSWFSAAASPLDFISDQQNGPLGEADGAVPDGTTVFDDDVPAVANLDPDLLGALRQAANDAADYGVAFTVNSGWRSADYQEHLLEDAVAKYGSLEEAARWVATPETSAHVSGDAIDLGPPDATAWLSEHGAAYGLCQIYANEPWHYELDPEAVDRGCPPMYADPTQDPRMQQ